MRNLTFCLFISLSILSVAHAAPFEGLTDNNHFALTYTGVWSDMSLSSAFAGSYEQTLDVSATVSFEIYADGLTVFFVYSPLGDDMSICINTDCTIVSTLGAESPGSVEIIGLDAGLKEVVISKDSSNPALVLNFDGFYVHPEFSGSDTVDFSYEGTDYQGVLMYRVTSGEILLSILLAALLCVGVINIVIGMQK